MSKSSNVSDVEEKVASFHIFSCKYWYLTDEKPLGSHVSLFVVCRDVVLGLKLMNKNHTVLRGK